MAKDQVQVLEISQLKIDSLAPTKTDNINYEVLAETTTHYNIKVVLVMCPCLTEGTEISIQISNKNSNKLLNPLTARKPTNQCVLVSKTSDNYKEDES